MNKILGVFTVFVSTAGFLFGQVLTTIPEVPVATLQVSIRFDTEEEQGELNGYTGRLFAHTGLNFSDGSSWQYVIGSWGNNATQPEFQYIGFNTFNLTLGPDLFTFYGAPTDKEITQIAIVIRSEDGSKQTQDYFIDIYPEGLQINVISPPEKITILELNDPYEIVAAANDADTMAIFQNGAYVKGTTLPTITHAFIGDSFGEHEFIIRAANETEEIRDTFYFFVRNEPIVENVPDGMVDGINYLSETSVLLSLFAPGKEHVFAIGDFSNWLSREDYYMKKNQEGNHFWIQIDNLEPGKLYRFYYLVDGELFLPDPHTELLVDPFSDKHISEETYPGIGELYQGLPEWQFAVIQTAQAPYPWNITDFIPPAKENLVIYELLLRDFLEAHDWKTLSDTLDYLDNLGINAIELMPFNEFLGNESWGYNPIYFMAPDKYYGPAEDLKAFVDECHARGIAVIQDIVFNHVEKWSVYSLMYVDNQGYPSSENPWLNEDFDLNDPNGWYQTRHPYSVFFDFDHSSIHTQNLMYKATRFWMEEYKIDGFRFDLTKGFTQKSTYQGTDQDGHSIYNESGASAYDPERISYLKRMADSIWEHNEQAYVILEHFCDNTEEKELAQYGMMLWGNSNYNYNEATMGYHENGNSDFSWISYQNRGWSLPHVVGYMESHDEERLMYKNLEHGKESGSYSIRDPWTALQRMELAGAFFFTIPGPKLIWQFGELGYDYSIGYDCRICNKPIRWDYYNVANRKKLYQVWSALIHLRTEEPAFASDDFSLSVSGACKRISINHSDMDVRVIGNFDVVDQSCAAYFSRTGWWYDFFSGDSIQVTNVLESISLQPGQFRIFTTKRLGTPDIIAGEKELEWIPEGFSVYPNPVSEILHMNPVPEKARLTILNTSGAIVRVENLHAFQNQIDLSSLPGGIYILSRRVGVQLPEYVKVFKE